jgi:hypothetical protein
MSCIVSHRATGSRCMYPLPSVWVTRQLIAQGLFLALLSTLGMAVSVTPSVALTITQAQEAAKPSAVSQQLRGQWQTKDPTTGKLITFIFAPDGNLFTVLPSRDGSSIAVKFGYKINPTTQPMQLDMIVSPDQTVMTIFELTPEGKLRLQLEGVDAEKPRPTTFNSNSTLFNRVSDIATVPKDVRVVELETEKSNAGQSVVKQFITILNKAQQAYYLENGKFASNVEELGIVTTLETENYRYQIVPQKDNTRSVMMTAIAKNPELPSYTSAVFAAKVNGKTTTTAQVCETEKPSTSPPTMPVPPTGNSLQVQCPAGSRPLE